MRIVKSSKSVTASSRTGVVYDKDGIVLTLTEKYNASRSEPDDIIGYIENTTDEPIDLTDYGHEQIIEPGKRELRPVEKDYFLINYILEMDTTPLTKEQVKELWDTTPMYIVWDDGSDSMCQDNDYSLDEILKYVDQGYCVYVDGDYTDVNSCDNIIGSTRSDNMRIVKSNKDVKASAKITKALKAEIFEELEAAGGYFNYDRAVAELMSDYSLSKKDAESIVWQFTTRNNVECCGDVKASKTLSANDQALQHIKAAIDILGKSGQKDEVTKDSIANLGVVMFDIKASKDSSKKTTCDDCVKVNKVQDNWEIGTVDIPDSDAKCEFQAKVYDEGSQYGIKNGRISKLYIKIDGKTVCNYDRGWDTKPTTPEAKAAYKAILKKYA